MQSSPDKNRKCAASSGGLFFEAMAASQETQADMVAAMQAVQQTELLATIRQTNTALVTHGQMCTGMFESFSTCETPQPAFLSDIQIAGAYSWSDNHVRPRKCSGNLHLTRGQAGVRHVGECLRAFQCIVVSQAEQTELLKSIEASQKNTEKACYFMDLSEKNRKDIMKE